MSEQIIIPSFAGLDVNTNQNITNPGALIEAFDVVCDKPGIVESNHSFDTFRDPIANTIVDNYQYTDPDIGSARILLYDDSDTMYYDDGLAFTPFAGSYEIPTDAVTIRAVEENKSFYFTEKGGVKVLDTLAGAIREAGIPRSLDPETNVTGQYSFTNGDIVQNTAAAQGYTSSVSCVDDDGNRYIAFAGDGFGGYSISKYDYLGNLVWKSDSLSLPGETVMNVASIGLTSTGNIYFSGMYACAIAGQNVNGRYITGAVGLAPNNNYAPYIVYYNSAGVLQWTCVFASVTALVYTDYSTQIYVDARTGFDQVYIGINANNPGLATATWALQYNVTSTTGVGTAINTYNRNCPVLVGFSTAGTLSFSSTAYVLAGGGAIAGIPIFSLSGFVSNSLLTLSVATSTTGLGGYTFNAQAIPTNSLVVFRLMIAGAAPATVRVLTYAQNRLIRMVHQDLSDGTTDTVFFGSRAVVATQIVSFTTVAVATATPAALANISAEINITATCPAIASPSLVYNYTIGELYFSCITTNGVNGTAMLGALDLYVIGYYNPGSWTAIVTEQFGGANLSVYGSSGRITFPPNNPSQNVFLNKNSGSVVLGGTVTNTTNTTGLYGETYISSANAAWGDYYSILADPNLLDIINTIEFGGVTSSATAIYINNQSFQTRDIVTLHSTGTLPYPLESGRQYVIASTNSPSAGFITLSETVGGAGIQIFVPISTAVHYISFATQPSLSYTNGFLPENRQVRYRAVIGRIDNSEYLKVGPPSGLTYQIPNFYANPSTVNLRIPIPDGLDTTYFVEIYRSLQTTFPTPPTDELFFSTRHEITGTDLSNEYVDIVDTVAEDNLGATLYTSPSQEGILQSNDQPPISTDIAFYKGLTLYSNTRYKQRFVFTFAWKNITDGTDLSLTDTYNILRVIQGGVDTFNIYLTSQGSVPADNFYYENNGDPTYCAYRSALNLIEAINASVDNTFVKAYLISTDGANVSILMEALVAGGDDILVYTPYVFDNYPLIIFDNPKFSDNAASNRIIVSKSQQPDAVPLANFYDVGPAGSTIKRIIPMRNSIFVLSDSGTYQILGNDLSQFQTNNYNLQMRILPGCDSSPSVLDNVLYFLSNNYVVACNEQTFDLIGKPVQPLFEWAGAAAFAGCYGIADKTNNRYMLIYNRADTVTDTHTVVYVYSSYTNQWTIWRKSAACGIIINDLLYLAYDPSNTSVPQDPKQVYSEVAQFTVVDYAASSPSVKLKMISLDNFAINKQFVKLYIQLQNPYPGDLTLQVSTDMEGVISPEFAVEIQTQNTAATYDYDKVVPGIAMTTLEGMIGRELYVTIKGSVDQPLTLAGAWVDWNMYGDGSL
jgi:hypothetical protein